MSNRKRENVEEEDEEESIVGVEFVEAGTMLDKDDGLEYQLPVPATFSNWCQQLMSQKQKSIQSIRGSLVQRFHSAGLSIIIRVVDPPQLQR